MPPPAKEAAEAKYEVVVVGAGIAGLATAVALHRANVRGVVLLDKCYSVRSEGAAAVMLFPNGWHAVRALGISHRLEGLYPACHRKKTTNLETGETKEILLSGTAESPGIGVRTVHRKTLIKILAEELPQNTIRFTSRLVKIDSEASPQSPSDFTRLQLEDGTVIKTKVLIGCDGVHSVVAQWLGLTQPVDSEQSVVRGLAEFKDPHGFPHEVQEFIYGDRRGTFVPLNDKEVYWYITHDTTLKDLERTRHPSRILRQVTLRLANNFPDSFLDVVDHSDPNTVTWTHMLYRPPWDLLLSGAHRGHITIAGDAYHPIAPDLSLGSCVTLEDAVVLARHVSNGVKNEDIKDAIEAYAKERRWRVVGLATGSYLLGWVQGGGPDSGFLRRVIKSLGEMFFERFVRPRVMEAMNYDCGSFNN